MFRARGRSLKSSIQVSSALITSLIGLAPCAAAAVAAPSAAPRADAQTAATAGASASSADAAGSATIQGVVITARRREENAQTVPVSASGFNAQALAAAGVKSTNDLQELVPGVILNGAGSDANTTYTIRGQGKAVIGPGLPSVITYFDEVPLPSWGSVLPTFDMDNVQVLKGPQGTLFGRNTTGGAVLAYSVAPSYNFGGYIEGDVGDYDEHSVQGAVNIPIINDKLAIRVAGDVERRHGYSHNISTGQDTDNVDSNAFRVSLMFTPTDWLKNTFVYDYYKADDNGPGIVALSPPLNPQLAPFIAAVQAFGPYTEASTVPSLSNVELWGVANTTTADFGAVTFKNIFGYRSTNVLIGEGSSGLGAVSLPLVSPLLSQLGFTAGTPGVLINTVSGRKDAQVSDEVQLSGVAFDATLHWIVGGFYLRDAPTGPDFLIEDVFRPTSPSPATLSIVNGFIGGIWPVGALADNLYTDESKALYGNVDYDLSEVVPALRGITLNAGVRYTWDTEGICANSRPSLLLATGQSVAAPYSSIAACQADPGGSIGSSLNPYGASFSQSVGFSAPTYTLGIDYKVNDDVFLYFTTRRGYRAGGLNSPAMAPVLAAYQTYQPQTVTDYEIGAHLQWSAGAWHGRFNIAAFTGDYSNLQLQATGITAGAFNGAITAQNAPTNTSITLNAGSTRVSGVEVSGALAPSPDLVFSYGASYLQAKYTSLNVPAIFNPFFSAGQIGGTPTWSFSIDGRYHIPVPDNFGQFYVNAEYYYIDKEYNGFALLPAYGLANFDVEWRHFAEKPVDLTFFVDNAFNQLYIHNLLLNTQTFGVFAGSYGPPRTFGVRLRYTFGG